MQGKARLYRLEIIVNWSVNWFACVLRSTCTSCRTPPSIECHAKPILWIKADKPTKIGCHGKVLYGSKKINFRSFIYSHSTTNLANLVKIGPVHVEIIGVIKIVLKTIHKKQKQNIRPPWWAKDSRRRISLLLPRALRTIVTPRRADRCCCCCWDSVCSRSSISSARWSRYPARRTHRRRFRAHS